MSYESSPCIRCGKERIKGKETIILINSKKAKLTLYICPDKECQKQVEAQLAAKEERRLSFTAKRNSHPNKKKTS